MWIEKILLLLCVLQYSVVSSIPRRTSKHYFTNDAPKICPEDQSLLSTKDITDMIKYVVEKQQLEENIVNSYYAIAVDIKNKHMKELKEFEEYIEDRPKHMKHILEDMANNRQKIEPLVEQVATKLGEIDIQSEKFDEVARRSNKLLRQLGLYRAVCEIHCEDTHFDSKFDHDSSIRLLKYLPSTACWSLKDLHDVIAAELNEFNENFSENILTFMEDKDQIYKNKVQSYKNSLIAAALNQFGLNMYDILSLQDSFNHFTKDLSNIDVTSQLGDIKKNTLKIEQLLMVIEGEVDKYREHCMHCHNNLRTRRDISTAQASAFLDNFHHTLDNRKTIDEQIDKTIKDIIGSVQSNITDVFAELEERLNDLDDIDSVMNKLMPVEDVDANIEQEQQALDALKKVISQSSIDKLTELLQKSEVMVEDLEEVKDHLAAVLAEVL